MLSSVAPVPETLTLASFSTVTRAVAASSNCVASPPAITCNAVATITPALKATKPAASPLDAAACVSMFRMS